MRPTALLLTCLISTPLLGLTAQGTPLKRTTIDSFVTSNMAFPFVPVFNRQRIYYLLRPDTLVLYDVASKRSRQIGVGQWRDLTVSRQGDLLAFTRPAEGTKLNYVWTLPVDPATGLPSGPARRASMARGIAPSISPDGKWIAFAADSDTKRLAIMPSSGGQERNIPHGPGDVWNIYWSANGQQLYFASTMPGKNGKDVIKRIPFAGGTAVTLADNDFSFDGLSIDGVHLLMDNNQAPWDLQVRDTSGRALPLVRAVDSSYITSDQLFTPTLALEGQSDRYKGLMSLPLSGGAARELLPPTTKVLSAAWSPDGRFFATTSEGDFGQGTSQLQISNSTGQVLHTFKLPTFRAASPMWAPDGQSIALLARQPERLLVIETTSGKIHSPPTTGIDFGSARWRSDSRHILYFSGLAADSNKLPRVRETTVDGTDRVVFSLPMNAKSSFSIFVSDTSAIATDDSSASIVSLTSGKRVKIYNKFTGKPTISPRGDLLVMRPPGPSGAGGRIGAEVITTAGVHVATISFPGIVGVGILDHFLFTPDEKSIIGSGRDAAGECCLIYQGFVDGRPTRTLGNAPTARGGPAISLSPDGSTLLYSAAGPWVTVFTTVDVSGVMKRSSN